jgi:hypothetical protein
MEVRAKTKKNVKPEDLIELMLFDDPISRIEFCDLAKEKHQIGRDRANDRLDRLITPGKISVLTSPRKGLRPENKYVRNRVITNQEKPLVLTRSNLERRVSSD